MLGTVPALQQYAADRGLTPPGLADPVLAAQALTRATDYIRHHYISRFGLGFGEAAANVLPAVYEAAILELTTPGFFNKVYTPGERKVLTEVQGIKWTVLGDNRGGDPTPVSPRIDALLNPYIGTGIGFMVI